MTNLGSVVDMLKKEHNRLTHEMKAISAALAAFGAAYNNPTKVRGTMSAAAKARIAAAQRARWAKVKAASNSKKSPVAMPKRRTMSAAARRKIAAAQRARWQKVKAAKKTA